MKHFSCLELQLHLQAMEAGSESGGEASRAWRRFGLFRSIGSSDGLLKQFLSQEVIQMHGATWTFVDYGF